MASRIEKNPIEISSAVEAKLANAELVIKGKLGELKLAIPAGVELTLEDKAIYFKPVLKQNLALTGTIRSLTKNMVQGVSEGFERKLTLVGVGYRAKAQGNKLDLTVGYSHPVAMEMPEGVSVETPSQTAIVLKGVDKQLVCQIAANIRAVRPPEPYKGKGIRYLDEQISLKEVKKK